MAGTIKLELTEKQVHKLVLYLGDFFECRDFTRKEREEVRQYLAKAVLDAAVKVGSN